MTNLYEKLLTEHDKRIKNKNESDKNNDNIYTNDNINDKDDNDDNINNGGWSFSFGGSENKSNNKKDNSKSSDKPEKNNTDKQNKNVDKTKKQPNAPYELYGKKYGINLETLNKLKEPLTELYNMIGLESIKNSIVDMVLYYLQHFENRNDSMLHTIIDGPPGVGKTELGKIIGKIYAKLGIVKSDKFKIVKRTDLIGEYLGHTAQRTQKAIDETDGGVLFIDEAYALGNNEKKDSFAKECIDTLNQNLSENKKKFICIIAGYSDELEKCFFAYNSGLKRRFPFRYKIEGYKHTELRDIFLKKLKDTKWKLYGDLDMKKVTEFFKDNMSDFPYYGGDVDNLIVDIKFMHSRRVVGKHPKHRRKITYTDVMRGFKRFLNNKKKKEMSNICSGMYI
jgi:SpoVK/Ycf46/Vps4 family AAA+-type ATPase